MNNKKLAEMIKEIKAQKVTEQIRNERQKKDTNVGTMPGAGHRHQPDINTFKHTIGALEKRTWQKRGNQSRDPGSYVSEGEDEKDLGDTDTGQKSKKNTEVVNINPTMKDIAGGGLTTTKGLESK